MHIYMRSGISSSEANDHSYYFFFNQAMYGTTTRNQACQEISLFTTQTGPGDRDSDFLWSLYVSLNCNLKELLLSSHSWSMVGT